MAHLPHGRIGEAGAGFGAGTAWMCEGLALTAHLSTVELEVTQAAAMRHLLHDRSNVEVLAGDWWQLERKVPFDLLFVDARPPKYGLADDLLTESL